MINVAIARARHKLIIVANTQHILNAHFNQGGPWFPNESILRKAIEEARKAAWINSLQILDLPSEDIKQSVMTLKSLTESQLSTLPAKWRAITEKESVLPASKESTYIHTQKKAERNREEDIKVKNRVGQQLSDYTLIHILGNGGFGDVYLAEHTYLKTQVAIKILHTYLKDTESQNFLKEARTIALLKHPNIVRVLDFRVDDSIPFLVMDYAPNGTLRKQHPSGIAIPLAVVISYVKQIAAALQYAHDAKLIHRDVKPENMLLNSNNEVLLSDFGIAVEAHSTSSMAPQIPIGTAAYMAPEQVQGKARPASDQYSLGIVVYEWLSGSRPFNGSDSDVCNQQIFVTPRPLSEKVQTIAPAVEQVVHKALSKDPLQRFESVNAFATALEKAF